MLTVELKGGPCDGHPFVLKYPVSRIRQFVVSQGRRGFAEYKRSGDDWVYSETVWMDQLPPLHLYHPGEEQP